MLFDTLEAEFLEYSRRAVEIPRAEQRARLLRELELSDPTRHAHSEQRPVSWTWLTSMRVRLGDGLTAAGIWLAGHRGDVL